MPHNAKIFIAEDDPRLLNTEKIMLRIAGHEVVLEALSLDKALDNVNFAKTKKVDVAVLDGNLGNGLSDGRQIADALRKEVPGVRIVALSGHPTTWGDLNLRKPGDIRNIVETITAL